LFYGCNTFIYFIIGAIAAQVATVPWRNAFSSFGIIFAVTELFLIGKNWDRTRTCESQGNIMGSNKSLIFSQIVEIVVIHA
jgi:hypothetical protein